VLHSFYSEKYQTWITRRWPRPQPRRTAAQLANQAVFASAIRLAKNAIAQERMDADALTKNTPLLQRDVLEMAAYGTLMIGQQADGTLWRSLRIMQNEVQPLLDSITQVVGAILVRSTDGWRGLAPGTIGQALLSGGAGAIPDWGNPTPDIQAGLDTISTTPGALLIRGTSAWIETNIASLVDILDLLDDISSTRGALLTRLAYNWDGLDPGTDASILRAHGTGADLSWDTLPSVIADVGGMSFLLDSITSGTGHMLIRTSGGWASLDDGSDRQILTQDPTTGVAKWKTGVIGTITNDNATAGLVGEYIEGEVLAGSHVTVTTDVNTDIVSISLTAGDWDVWGTVVNEINGTAIGAAAWISNASATLPTVPNKGAEWLERYAMSNVSLTTPVGFRRFSLASTTTIYLTTRQITTTGTNYAYGIICARRVR
jgi:hypothetical protein